jgi:hypothetical protein
MKKTTIYIDIEDDIASMIAKIIAAEQKIVALVLPKRPTVLQSSVNMRLLKQSSDAESKSIVLITTDAQVSRLAGDVGVHISSSLQSKPHIPKDEVPNADESIELTDTGESAPAKASPIVESVDTDAILNPSLPVGVLAGIDPMDGDDEIDLESEPDDDAGSEPDASDTADEKPPKSPKKKISVPNFGSFGTKLALGLVLLLAGGAGVYWALVVAPKASVVVSTERSTLPATVVVTAQKDLAAVDADKNLVPASRKEDVQKLTGTFLATGQKDVGTKASGTVTFKNCENSTSLTIPSGTGVSKGAYTFITQKSVTLSGGTFSGGGSVCTSASSEAVSVVASASGDQYNIAAGTYTVAGGFGNIVASGQAMGGGTSKLVKVVTDEDIESAKSKVLAGAADNVKGKLTQLLQSSGLIAIDDTFLSTTAAPVPSAPSGAEAPGDISISVSVTSSMLGVKLSDIEPLATKELTKKLNPKTQKIYTTNLSKAAIKITERPNPDSAVISLNLEASVGPLLDKNIIAKSIAGKKAGDAKQIVAANPGVSNVDIRLSPFWVFTVPSKQSKITVVVNE